MHMTDFASSRGEYVSWKGQAERRRTLVRDPQTFIALGAMGQNAEIPFQADGCRLPRRWRNPAGCETSAPIHAAFSSSVTSQKSVARQLAPTSPLVESGRLTPVIYRLDLANPNGMFLEQSFHVANRDVIYVSNSPSTEVQKVFGIISGGIGTVGSIASTASAGASIAH